MTKVDYRPHPHNGGPVTGRDVYAIGQSIRRWVKAMYEGLTSDEVTDFDAAAVAAAQAGIDITNGTLLTSQALTTGENTVTHGLGREPKGCVLVRDSVAPVSFSAHRTSAQTITTATVTKVQFSSERYDYGSAYDSASGYDFTAPHAGLYSFKVGVHWNGNITADSYLTLVAGGNTYWIARGQSHNAYSGAIDVELAAGDTVYANVSQSSGSDKDLQADRVFFAGKALTELKDQQIGYSEASTKYRLWSECDRTADLWVF